MTKEQYNRYTVLSKKVEELERYNARLLAKQSSKDKLIIEEGWLELTYGNGSDSFCVCDIKELMLQIKDLILNYHLNLISKYQKEIEEL